MYSLLVVDDEKYAVMGITRGIDWTELGIDNIDEAYNSKQAMEIFKDKSVDIMICDIEMPEQNGIELLEWVRENFPATETVFLTGHANFAYAQKAIQLGSFDYLLKPVDHDILKEVVAKALNIVRDRRQEQAFKITYGRYQKLWEKQLSVLRERFWQDVISHRINIAPKELQYFLSLYEIPLLPAEEVLPVLIMVEQWEEELNAKDEEIMLYAVRNVAEEVILKDLRGLLIQEHDGNNIVLLYNPPAGDEFAIHLKERCNEFIEACNQYLRCSLSCYIGTGTSIDMLSREYTELREIEQNNISNTNTVMLWKDSKLVFSSRYHQIHFTDLQILLETGNKEELLKRLDDTLEQIDWDSADYETLDSFYHGMLYSLYQVLHKYGLSMKEMLEFQQDLGMEVEIRTKNQICEWAKKIMSGAADYLNSKETGSSAIIKRVQKYIQKHIHEDISREEIAMDVLLSPTYLSRLFKKETGIILNEYIAQLRINEAKRMLEETNEKISVISESVGYYHFSHFAKIFKKSVGISPQDYRKQYSSFQNK